MMEEQHKDNIIFCTECDDDLAYFCFLKDADDIKIIRKRQEQCRKSGKFKGEMCSKLFIASAIEPDG
jgi:hypothetical protein